MVRPISELVAATWAELSPLAYKRVMPIPAVAESALQLLCPK